MINMNCIEVKLERLVVMRPPFDRIQLTSLLREKKKERGLTTKEIAESLNLSLTEVEHWFRTDAYGNAPSPDIWNNVRDLMGIEGWDEVGSVIYKDNVFEMAGRAYLEDGVCPTILLSPPMIVKTNKSS